MFNLVTILLYLSAGYSLPCLHRDQMGDFRQVTKINIIDKPDRLDTSQYAEKTNQTLESVEKTFAPTGRLVCPWGKASAQLTIRNDVITTTAHNFFDEKTCKRLGSPSSCKFVVREGAKERSIKVHSKIELGFNCPTLPDLEDDWAVLKLAEPLNDVEPYSISEDDEKMVKPRDSIVAVSGGASEFKINGKAVKTISDCNARDAIVRSGAIIKVIASDCDSGHGSSGGSVLKVGNGTRPVLVGLIVAGNETLEEEKAALATNGSPNTGTYEIASWATYSVLVTGKLRQALTQLKGPKTVSN